jgi:hypothetical protein
VRSPRSPEPAQRNSADSAIRPRHRYFDLCHGHGVAMLPLFEVPRSIRRAPRWPAVGPKR